MAVASVVGAGWSVVEVVVVEEVVCSTASVGLWSPSPHPLPSNTAAPRAHMSRITMPHSARSRHPAPDGRWCTPAVMGHGGPGVPRQEIGEASRLGSAASEASSCDGSAALLLRLGRATTFDQAPTDDFEGVTDFELNGVSWTGPNPRHLVFGLLTLDPGPPSVIDEHYDAFDLDGQVLNLIHFLNLGVNARPFWGRKWVSSRQEGSTCRGCTSLRHATRIFRCRATGRGAPTFPSEP